MIAFNEALPGQQFTLAGTQPEGFDTLYGIPAIAFSLAEKGWEHIDSAARAARMRAVGYIGASHNGPDQRARLLDEGAFEVIDDLRRLPQIIQGEPRA